MKRLIDSLRGLLGGAGRTARALSLAGAALAIAVPASAGETVTHIHNDPFGTPVMATDAAGNVVWKETYRPYGSKLNNQPASAGNKIGFTGHPFDASTGLSYMGARYYDPVLGRFMGVDPAPPSLDNVHSLNRYTYANNNPYRYVDPDGRAGVAALVPPLLLIGGGWWWATQSAEQQERMIRDASRAASWVRGLVFNEGSEGGGSGADADAGTAGAGSQNGQDQGNRKPSPFLPNDPYSPEEVGRRQSGTRVQEGASSLDPDAPIPDRGPGKDMGGHEARGRTPHETGERNVNSNEEHSRRPKGNPIGTPRR